MLKSKISVALIAAVAIPGVAQAALSTYEPAVLANNPYVFYRQNDASASTGSTVLDSSGNGRHGVFQGSPTTGVVGNSGLNQPSDNAISYSGSTSGAATNYFGVSGTGATGLRDFGALIGTSSYEFVFKTNPGFPTGKQSLFGVFNTGTSTAVEVTLNSQGNDALADAPNTTRIYIRGDNGPGIGAHFVNADLYDGNYHHLVFTFDASQVTGSGATLAGGFTAYVDGVPQALTLTQVASSPAGVPNTFSAFGFDPTFLARNVRTTLGGTAVARQANVTLDEAALYATVLSPEAVALHAAAVPEPAGLAFAGAAALGLLRRRR